MGAGQVGKAASVPKGEVHGQAGPKTTKIKLYLSELSAPSGLLPVGIPKNRYGAGDWNTSFLVLGLVHVQKTHRMSHTEAYVVMAYTTMMSLICLRPWGERLKGEE